MPIDDCRQTANAGEVNKSDGACCYTATVDNVNLLTGELTVTFTGTPPAPLPAQVIVPGANVRYNCGLCYTFGLASNMPALGFERLDSVLALMPSGLVPQDGTDGSGLFVIGHEFANGVEDQKACGQMGFLPLWPQNAAGQGYGEPFLALNDDETECVLVAPYYYGLFASMGIALGTLGGINSSVMVYADDLDLVALKPYLLPAGGTYQGYPRLDYQIVDAHFAYGVRLPMRSSHEEIVISSQIHPKILYSAQQPRHIGTAISGESSVIIDTGSLYTYSGSTGESQHYIARYALFQSDLFLIDTDAQVICVPDHANNELRKYQYTFDPVTLAITVSGTYTTAEINEPIDIECVYTGTVWSTPVHNTTYGYFQVSKGQTNNTASVNFADTKLFNDGNLLGISMSMSGSSSMDVESYSARGATFNFDGSWSNTRLKTFYFNGAKLCEITLNSISYSKYLLEGSEPPSMEVSCSGDVQEWEGPAPGAPYTDNYIDITQESGDCIFIALSLKRDFAIYIKYKAVSTAHYDYIAGTKVWQDSSISTLYVYSKGVVTELDTATYSVNGSEASGARFAINLDTFGGAISSGSGTLVGDCTYGTGQRYTKTEYSNATTTSVYPWYNADLLDYPLNPYNMIPVITDGGTYTVVDSKFRGGLNCWENPFGGTPLIEEFSISDDGALAWVVIRELDGVGVHRLLIKDGVVTQNAESQLDAVTGMTWGYGTFSYADVD